MLQNTDIF